MLGNELEELNAEVVDNPEQVVDEQPAQPQPQPLPIAAQLAHPPQEAAQLAPPPQEAAQLAQPPQSTTPIININFIGNVSRANQELVSQLLATGQLPSAFAAPPTPPPTPPPALARPHPGPMRNRGAQSQQAAPWELAQAPVPARRGPGRPPGRRSTGVSFMAALANMGHSIPPFPALGGPPAVAGAAGPARAQAPFALAGPAQAPLASAGPAQAPLASAGPAQAPLALAGPSPSPLALAGPSEAPPAPAATSTCMVCRCPRDDLGIIIKCRHLICLQCKNALLRRGGVGHCPNGYCQVMFAESDFLLFRT